MIDVALTRAHLRPAEVAVVVDVLRASTTATQALAASAGAAVVVAGDEATSEAQCEATVDARGTVSF